MSHHHLPRYELSGKMNPGSVLVILLKAVLAATVLGALYAVLIFYVPFIYILCLFTLGFGALLGEFMVWAMVKSEVRNGKAFLLFSTLAAVVGVYVHWIVWLMLYGEGLIINPVALLETITHIGEFGVWSLRAWRPTGTTLYAIWGLEALGVIALSLVMNFRSLSELVYCENCKKWVENSEREGLLYTIPKEDVMKRIQDGDLEAIKALRPYKNSKSEYELEDPSIKLILEQCTTCKSLYILSLFISTPRMDSEGELHYDQEPILEKVLVPETLFKAMSAS